MIINKIKELTDRLNSLDLALRYNEVKGDYDSVAEIHDEIYKVRQEIKSLIKSKGEIDMNIDVNNLGARIKGTTSIYPIGIIDFDKKVVSFYSFGKIVHYSLYDVDIVLCDW